MATIGLVDTATGYGIPDADNRYVLTSGNSNVSSLSGSGNGIISVDNNGKLSLSGYYVSTITNLISTSGNHETRLVAIEDGTALDSRYVNITGDVMSGDLTINADLIINGDIIQISGSNITQIAETSIITDNLLILNSGELGNEVSLGESGIQIDRGNGTPYQFMFIEDLGLTQEVFAVGMSGQMQPVATREEVPISGAFACWNSSTGRFETDSLYTTSTLATQTDISVHDTRLDAIEDGTTLDSRYVNSDGDTMSGNLKLESTLVFSGISGVGIQIDNSTPSYGWRDIISDIIVRGSGVNSPTLNTFRGTISAFQFDTTDECFVNFHIPHDYVPGTEMYIHVHWGLNVAVSSNSITFNFDATYSKRNDVALPAFHVPITVTASHNAGTTTIPQYAHIVTETQLTTGGYIDGSAVEVDGLILARITAPTNTLGQNPFIFYCDLHYQSTNLATKNKAPNFYT